MNLLEFKNHIQTFPDGFVFNYGISEPFSWRGVYAEVAFEMLDMRMSKEDVLANIEKAYTETFCGYKGGEYIYNDYTDIHFETDYRSWTDGRYVSQWISKIEEKEEYQSQEARLVKLSFNKKP
jgi:hypothetical protein